MPELEDTLRAQLLHSVSEAACAVTGARAASVALFDEPTGDLVFVATAGEGADDVVGGHFPHDAGIAGQVLRTGEPIHATDLFRDPRWARDVGTEAGAEPDAIVAVPVVWHERVVGVLEVLDPDGREGAMRCLATLAAHAGAALEVSATLVGEVRPV
jgi:GAF domain-containing protein